MTSRAFEEHRAICRNGEAVVRVVGEGSAREIVLVEEASSRVPLILEANW